MPYPRSRSRSPNYRARAYSPSRAVSRSPPPPPRRYDDHRERDPPPPRRYDERPPPPRRYDEDGGERIPPPRRYDDRDRDYENEYGRDHESRDVRRDGRGERRYDDRRDERDWRDRRDRDRDRGHGYGHDEWDERGRGHGGGGGPPSEPSRDVIFLGLDPELSDAELVGFLRTEHGAPVDSAKIVRDRMTGQSKCFGFAQFSTLRDAQTFVSANYPNVLMPALYAHSEPRRVKIDFAGERGERGGPDEQYAAPAAPPGGAWGHDGTRDIGPPGGVQRVLLLRGVEPGTYAGEIIHRLGEEISRMLGKPGAVAEGAITRVAMVVDRGSSAPWSFAFVELVTPELAAALLPFLILPQHQPNGFLIAGVPVAASFANPAAFVPTAAGPLGGQFLLRAAGEGGFGSPTVQHPEGEFCAYWHQQAGVVETVPQGAPPVPPRGQPVEIPLATRALLGNLAGKPHLEAVPTPGAIGASAGPASAGPSGDPTKPLTMQPIKIGGFGSFGAKKKKPAAEEDVMIPIINKNPLLDDDEDLVGKDTVLLSRTKGARIIPPTSTSRKIAKNISKWNTKQVELAKPGPPANPNGAPRGVSSVNAIDVKAKANATDGDVSASNTHADAKASPASPAVPPTPQLPPSRRQLDTFDYSDASKFDTTGKVACLLCQRQFNSEDMLRKHNAQSDLHKTNLSNTTTVEAGRRRKAAAVAAAATMPSNLAYRDRAAERREVHHLPDRPALDPTSSMRPGQRPAAPSQPTQQPNQPRVPSPPPPPPAADGSNVGNKLLAKMGWSTGTGLGREGEGRVEPIKVHQFDERVGLGAAKGREAGKWSGPGGWNERKKDMTKERYEAADKGDQN